jgi:simple sugar transport system permease protein
LETAELPRFTELFGREIGTGRLHLGFIVALLMAVAAYYFLFRTTWGFSLRTTGLNPRAAEYAGIRPKREYILAMMLGGGMAGLAGILEVQGLSTRVVTEGIASGYGFDAIAVSFLAFNQPLSIIPSAFVFGVLRTGSFFLQSRAGLSVHVVSILQALILLFVAAPAIIRSLYRVKPKGEIVETEPAPLTQGWGG